MLCIAHLMNPSNNIQTVDVLYEKNHHLDNYDPIRFVVVTIDMDDEHNFIIDPLIVNLNSTTYAIHWINLSDEDVGLEIPNPIDFRVKFPPYFSGTLNSDSSMTLKFFDEQKEYGIKLATGISKYTENGEIITRASFSEGHKVIFTNFD